MKNNKFITSIMVLLALFIMLAPIVHSEPPPLLAPNLGDCQGSWDCYWWAKFYDLIDDLVILLR